jgi:hypothetical protein
MRDRSVPPDGNAEVIDSMQLRDQDGIASNERIFLV